MVNGYRVGSVLFMLNIYIYGFHHSMKYSMLVIVSIVLRTLPRQNYRLCYVYTVFFGKLTFCVTDCRSCVCIKSGSCYP